MDNDLCTFELSNSVCMILPLFPPSRASIVLPVADPFLSLRWATPYTECLALIVLLGNRSVFVSMRPLSRESVGGFSIVQHES